MKYSLPLLALASSAVATFRNAKPFPCPANIDNKCTEQQKPGFSFDDLQSGDFAQYKDFIFSGWKANGGGGGRFDRRTGRKAIGGTCGPDKRSSPSFGCGPSVDKFSLGHIVVRPEFDCDLEFHYDMPDGKTCKHRNRCSKSGTTVVNTQCGGAKNVTIIYPPQPDKPKPSCSIEVPTVSFDCSTASSTVPPKTPSATPSSTVESTPTSEATVPTPSEVSPSSEAVSSGIVTYSEATPSSDVPVTSKSSSVLPISSPSLLFPNSSSTPQPQSSLPTLSTPTYEGSTTTIVTSFQSTSTIFTTLTSTITSCEDKVTDCPADSVTTTVVTVPLTTTVCPVTETLTTVIPSSAPDDVPTSTPKDGETTEPPVPAVSSTSTVIDTVSSVSSVSPIETLPCPEVVPSCLNTFLFSVGCSHNSDAECFCPDSAFVKEIFNCIYAHGESDDIISEAVTFFQGICAPYLGSNPGIATDATVTTYITATATPTVSVVTTVTLDLTTVVPCTDEAGSTIESSSTTTVLSTTLTVPQVGFTTGTDEEVNIIPITTPLPVISQTPGDSDDGFVPTESNFFTTAAPTGTGAYIPSATPSFVTAGAGRTGAGVGFMVCVAGFIAALV